MEKVYLENAKEMFLKLRNESYSRDSMVDFYEMIGIIIPNRINAEELIIFIDFLVNDIKDEICRFNNSCHIKNVFYSFIKCKPDIEKLLSYLPEFLEVHTKKEFYDEFYDLFKMKFYHLECVDTEDYGYKGISKDDIDISNKSKADVLAALYNYAKPIGLGVAHFDPTPMTSDLAQYYLDNYGYKADYIKGRPIKINLESNVINLADYNNYNNKQGLGQKAVSSCPNVLKKTKS